MEARSSSVFEVVLSVLTEFLFGIADWDGAKSKAGIEDKTPWCFEVSFLMKCWDAAIFRSGAEWIRSTCYPTGTSMSFSLWACSSSSFNLLFFCSFTIYSCLNSSIFVSICLCFSLFVCPAASSPFLPVFEKSPKNSINLTNLASLYSSCPLLSISKTLTLFIYETLPRDFYLLTSSRSLTISGTLATSSLLIFDSR